jgi:hypothetical protein
MLHQIRRPRFVEEAGYDGNVVLSFPWWAFSDGTRRE